jgi:hypothetical protein
MSQEICQSELQEKTQKLLQGPLKHIRAAALAAALLPLASVAAVPASAQTQCNPSGGTVCALVSGTVFYDADNDGTHDSNEVGFQNVVVTVIIDGVENVIPTLDGSYSFYVPAPGTYTIEVQIPPGTQPSPGTALCENDNTSVCATVTVTAGPNGPPNSPEANFGISQTTVFPNPGTGTPGYWKNHPEAWPVEYIKIGYTTLADGTKVGGTTYSKLQALGWLENVPKDKRTTMFSSLVPAMLNVILGNDPRCVQDAIRDANAWMATRLPMEDATKKVAASSAAWKVGEPLHQTMDNYNNGGLCAPHRD